MYIIYTVHEELLKLRYTYTYCACMCARNGEDYFIVSVGVHMLINLSMRVCGNSDHGFFLSRIFGNQSHRHTCDSINLSTQQWHFCS
jgi:hypothetical protein